GRVLWSVARRERPRRLLFRGAQALTFDVVDVLDAGRKAGAAMVAADFAVVRELVDVAAHGLHRDAEGLGQFLVGHVAALAHDADDMAMAVVRAGSAHDRIGSVRLHVLHARYHALV